MVPEEGSGVGRGCIVVQPHEGQGPLPGDVQRVQEHLRLGTGLGLRPLAGGVQRGVQRTCDQGGWWWGERYA